MKYRVFAFWLMTGSLQALSNAAISAIPTVPFKHATREFVSNVITTPSSSEKVVVLDLLIDHQVTSPPRVVWLPRNHVGADGEAHFTVLFAYVVNPSGVIHALNWHIDTSAADPSGPRWVVVDDYRLLTPGSSLEMGTLTRIDRADGFFVGDKNGVQTLSTLKDFSGCFRIASGIPFSVEHNDGVTVSRILQPGSGYHGWCYRYAPTPEHSKYYLHYFAASSARSWSAVAELERSMFQSVASKNSLRLWPILEKLGVRTGSSTNTHKINAISTWMNRNLRYSTEDMYAEIPRSFDRVVQDGFGDCKGLSLVLLELLRGAGLHADLVLTSTRDKWPFLQNASNFQALDHVAVYLPDQDRFLDPTAGNGPGLVGHQALDVETGKILTIR